MKTKFKTLDNNHVLRSLMAVPLNTAEIIQRDIKEREADLINLKAIELLIENKDTACKIVVCLPNDNVIEHWIDTNQNLWNTLYTERALLKNEINSLKAKLEEVEVAEKGGPGPVEHEESDPFAPITGPIAGIPLTENQEEELNVEAPSAITPNNDLEDF